MKVGRLLYNCPLRSWGLGILCEISRMLTRDRYFSGSGYVEIIGGAVKGFQPGDPVLLSFNSCGDCYSCRDNNPAYCVNSDELNFGGDKSVYASEGSSKFNIGGTFFGQSSFASHAIVKEKSVVNLQGLIDSEEDLKLLAPLGCGIQTGTGALVNTADVKAGQDVAVLGVGGVGQAAIMVKQHFDVKNNHDALTKPAGCADTWMRKNSRH